MLEFQGMALHPHFYNGMETRINYSVEELKLGVMDNQTLPLILMRVQVSVRVAVP